MLTFLKGFFLDDTKAPSMTRLVSFVTLIVIIAVAAVIVFLSLSAKIIITEAGLVIPPDVTIINALIYLIIVLFSIATGGKVIQSFADRTATVEPNPQVKP